jgi:hypothetical protein
LTLSASTSSIIELLCSLSVGYGAVFEEAHELGMSKRELLPNWGVGWRRARSATLEVKYRTAGQGAQVFTAPINLVVPPLKELGRCENAGVYELLQELQKLRGRTTRDDLAKRLGPPLFSLHYDDFGHLNDYWEYLCSDLGKGELPTCTLGLDFSQGGVFLGASMEPINQAALRHYIEGFSDRLRALDFVGEEAVAAKVGQPHFKLGDRWYFRLPQAPENVLFGQLIKFGRVVPRQTDVYHRERPMLDRRACEGAGFPVTELERRKIAEVLRGEREARWTGAK